MTAEFGAEQYWLYLSVLEAQGTEIEPKLDFSGRCKNSGPFQIDKSSRLGSMVEGLECLGLTQSTGSFQSIEPNLSKLDLQVGSVN